MAGGGVTPPVPSKAPSPLLNYSTVRDLLLMGLLRGATVILGLVSISHVAISFTETIKASAPLFTVVFSYFILGERTSAPVIGTLLPVAVGLVVCSAYELDYDVIGEFPAGRGGSVLRARGRRHTYGGGCERRAIAVEGRSFISAPPPPGLGLGRGRRPPPPSALSP